MVNQSREDFNSKVEFLRKVVPPDDIYIFAEQCLSSGEYLAKLLAHFIPVDIVLKDNNANKIINNIMSIRVAFDNNNTTMVNVDD